MEGGRSPVRLADGISGFISWGGFWDPLLDGGIALAPSSSSSSSPYSYRRPSGKRQCCLRGVSAAIEESPAAKRASSAAVKLWAPRCQVEGCDKALGDAKDYHKRHKVCEMHSKAPCVVVLGTEQRFCQQCSRFHLVSEFDDAKRSCRRRLAGHNERRRKGSSGSSFLESTVMSSTFPFIISPARTSGRALSLLSSKTAPWLSESELSSRSSAALRELVFENRTAASLTSFASPVPASASSHINCYDPYSQISGWEANAPLLQPSAGHHPTTLDLIRVMPNPSAEFMPGSNISRNGDRLSQGDFGDFWRSFPTHLL